MNCKTMLTIGECQELIDKAIREINLPAEPSQMYEPIRYVLKLGGKRIRPTLVIMACNVYSDNIKPAIYPALAIEVFHNFTLLHDDIMDNADFRRNHPTVHIKWNRNVGILSGDAMLIKSYELLSKASLKILPGLFALFNKTALKVCEGQQYDMNYEVKDKITMEEYLKMIELKTSVLIAASLKMGAIVAGANEKDTNLFYEFGRNLGIAFQLQDDFLDLYADPYKFGKELGNDIVSNKKTILLVQAMQLAKGADKKRLTSWLRLKEFNREEKIRAIGEIFDKLKLREITKKKIQTYYDIGIDYLNQIPVDSTRKTELFNIARIFLERSR